MMKMLDYIQEQAPLFASVLENRKNIVAPLCAVCARVRPQKICLIASGTSRNAALAAAPFMEALLALDVQVLAPSQVKTLRNAPTLAIVISQGGNSTNSLAVFDRLQGIPTVAMTGSPYGHLNKKGDTYLEIPCGEELAGPKTKGYTITILTLYLTALEYALQNGSITAETYERIVGILRQAAAQLPGNIAAAEAWTQNNRESLKNLSGIYLVGKMQGMETAAEGALKLMETLLIPGFAFDFEEFLHGPACSLHKATGGFYLLPTPDDPDHERMQRLVAYHREICPAVYTVGLAAGTNERDCIVQTTGQWYTQPFEQILPMQMAAAHIPALLDLADAGVRRFERLDAVMGIKQKNKAGMI